MNARTRSHPHARRPRRRRLVRPRDVAVAVTAVVATGSAIAIDALAQEPAGEPAEDVRSAVAGAVRPAPAPRTPSPEERAAILVAASELGDDRYQPHPADEVAAVRTAVDDFAEARERRRAAERAAVWDRLADCESGEWGRDGTPIPGTATWDYGLAAGQDGFFEGGLQFHPATWDHYRPSGSPDHAGAAPRALQVAVAEEVLADQGWRAWPVCSRKLGYR